MIEKRISDDMRGYSYAYINPKGLEVPQRYLAHPTDLLEFRVKTYQKLGAKRTQEEWDGIFKEVNSLLNNLSTQHRQIMLEFYLEANRRISEIIGLPPEECDNIATDIGVLYVEAISKTTLLDDVNALVETLPYPDLSGIGSRAHDRKDITFDARDYKELTALAIFSKMLAPLWGQFIFYLADRSIGTSTKEILCEPMITALASYGYRRIAEKFYHYTANVIETKNVDNMAMTYNGLSHELLILYTYSITIVKKFINTVLGEPDTNLMNLVYSSISSTADSQNSSVRTKNNMQPRYDNTKGEDEGNTSKLESESYRTRTTADTLSMVHVNVQTVIDSLVQKYKIDKYEFNEAIKYYDRYPIQVTTFNKSLIATVLGADIGGGLAIDMLNAKLYSRVAAIVQLFLIKLNQYTIAHLVTATHSSVRKDRISTEDIHLAQNFKASTPFQSCHDKFSHKLGSVDFVKFANDIVSEITAYEFRYNTAPNIWQYIDLENLNKDPVRYDELVIMSICNVILYLYGDESQTEEE